MREWRRCNKVSGTYWPKLPIDQLSFKINLKPTEDVVPLPKFEDYVNASDASKLERLESKTEEYVFRWQQKVLSRWEIHQYSDIHNCSTEQQLRYHEDIKNGYQEFSRLFTYVNEDNYVIKPSAMDNETLDDISRMAMLGSCFKRLKLDQDASPFATGVIEPSWRSLGRSVGRRESEEQWVAMHIMMDGSERDGDMEVIMKREALLVSVYWSVGRGCLVLHPDVSSLQWNPYAVEADGADWSYQYSMQFAHDDAPPEMLEKRKRLERLVRRLAHAWQHRHRHLVEFATLPPHVTRYHYTMEILSADQFDDDDLFIEYEVRGGAAAERGGGDEGAGRAVLAEGRTHTASKRGSSAHYSHLVQFQLDCRDDAEDAGPGPRVYVEVISRDRWGRERTQGVALHRPLLAPSPPSLVPLPCVRPAGCSPAAKSRRFFLGGARLLEDVSWIGVPEGHEGKTLNKFGVSCVTCGTVLVRAACVAQRGGVVPAAGAVCRSVESVLRAYGRARERLAACRRELGEGTSGLHPKELH